MCNILPIHTVHEMFGHTSSFGGLLLFFIEVYTTLFDRKLFGPMYEYQNEHLWQLWAYTCFLCCNADIKAWVSASCWTLIVCRLFSYSHISFSLLLSFSYLLFPYYRNLCIYSWIAFKHKLLVTYWCHFIAYCACVCFPHGLYMSAAFSRRAQDCAARVRH